MTCSSVEREEGKKKRRKFLAARSERSSKGEEITVSKLNEVCGIDKYEVSQTFTCASVKSKVLLLYQYINISPCPHIRMQHIRMQHIRMEDNFQWIKRGREMFTQKELPLNCK